MKMLRNLVGLLGLLATGLSALASGPVLMVHGHIDKPALWAVQGPALALASSDTRFYDRAAYYRGELPAAGFKTNGIYAVSYYQRSLAPGQFEPPISPVLVGSTEIPPDYPAFVPFLYQQPDSLAARLAQTINAAYTQSGQKVTLVCHSMGGLVAEAAIAYFGCQDKVEKFITIGTPLRGFPADFRIPTEIIANQSGRGFGFVRETLQMSEGVLFGGQSFSVLLENRYKLVKPPGLTAVNIVGTLNPFPEAFLDGPSDGVVRAVDAKFRDSSLAPVYELPLAHMQRMAELWSAPEDALCTSSNRTTQILEKEVLGLDPLPRLGTHQAFNYGTGRVRVTVRNDGGLPVTFASVSGRFDLVDPKNSSVSRVATSPLSGLAGQTLQPGEFLVVDGISMQRGEKASAWLTLTVNGRTLATGEETFIANIQAPEVEVSLRYDFVNSVLQSEWNTKGGGRLQAVAWNANYRLEGQASYDAVSNRLQGTLTARFYSAVTGVVAAVSSNLFFSESFNFDLDLATRTFTGQGSDILGKTTMPFADAASSRLRSLYRAKLLSVVTNPEPFVIEGDFSGLAGLKLDRPVFQYDPETHGLALNMNAILVLGFSDSGSDRLMEIPMQASCSTLFIVNQTNGLTLKPRVRKLSTPGMALGENYRLLINRAIEANEFVVPAELTSNLNELMRDALQEFLGPNSVKTNYAFFDGATIAVDPNPTRLRILMDLYDDAIDGSQNTYVGVPENGIAIQDRLVNQLLARSVGLVNKGMARSGQNVFKLGLLIPVPGTSIYYDYPVLGPVSIGVGFDGVKWYFEKVRLTVNPSEAREVLYVSREGGSPVLGNYTIEARELQVVFAGPLNKVHVDVPLDAKFYNQLRSYFALRIGVHIPFVGFVGYTKRWEEKDWRITANETLAVDIDANVYPYISETNRTTGIGVRFPPKEIDLETNFDNSKGFLIPILGELVVDPLFSLAKNRPEFFGLVGGTVGGLIGAFAPELAEPAITAATEEVYERVVVKAISATTNAFGESSTLGNVAADFEDGDSRIGLTLTNLTATLKTRSIMATAGFAVGVIGGAKLAGVLEDAFKPQQYETSVDLPAGIRLTDLTINSRAARLAFDVEPAYGKISVTTITGLDATNGVVPLTRDDLVFSTFDGGPFTLTYTGGGEHRRFSSVWVKKPVSKVRMQLRYEAIYVHRYNTNSYSGYSLKQRRGDAGSFTIPADYAYASQTDTASFSIELPLLEGQTMLQQVSLKVPKLKEKRIPFLVGRDTAPVLINAPFAAYSGVTSNVTVSAGTLVFQSPPSAITGSNSTIPGFVLEELKLLDLSGAGGLLDLKPIGLFTTNTFGPAATRVPRLYGAQFSWTGSLSPAQFPEGSYAALVTIRETALNRKGSLLIPFIIDRTAPVLDAWTVTEGVGVVSRHQDLSLVWRLADAYSAVMNDVRLTYQKQNGPVVTGAMFTPDGKVMIPGQRRLDFTVNMASVPDGVEDTYSLQFHATDVPGNRGTSSNLTFLVDTRPPTFDSLFVYPANSIVNQSNRILTVRFRCPEHVTARFLLADQTSQSTNDWYATSGPLNDGSGMHQVVWVLELPDLDPDQGLLEGVVADGLHKLSIELVDRGSNTNFYSNLRTIVVDRRAPIMTFGSQQTFIPSGRTVFPLDVNTSGFMASDQITSIALVNLNYFTPTSSVTSATIKTWTGGQIAGVLASGIPLDRGVLGIGPAGTFLDPGFYGVEVKARDNALNESRITTQFGYQLMRPHVEAQGYPKVSGIVPLVGYAVDPNPADRFPFASRELYWALGHNVAAPTNLNSINLALWQKAGLYVLPPRGNAFANELNKSTEMVSQGILSYWNTTAAALTLEGDSQASITAAGIVNNDVTLLLVVRDQGGQAWAGTSSVRVDNRQTDLTSLTAPGVQVLSSTVNNHTLSVNGALLRDTPLLQMVVVSANGNAVHRTTRANVESRNSLFGRPNYSLENDFGFFVWYDEVAGQLKVRCVAPDRDSQGALLNKGHTFHFSLTGEFGTNDLSYHQLLAGEIPDDEKIYTNTNGLSRVAFSLNVPPGTEKGIAINYNGGTIRFNALGIDDYLQVLYENGAVVEKRFWRADDAGSVASGYLGLTPFRNLVGLDGTVMNGSQVDLPDHRAVANHGGALGHVFVGHSRTEPISPVGIMFDSATIQPDLTLGWDLKLPNGSYAEPGEYQVFLYSIDPEANRFHGARSTFTLSPSDVPFAITGMLLSTTNAFNPKSDGGIILNFNASRSSAATVYIRNAQGQIVATIANGQALDGRTDLNGQHQVWWDGFVDGVPATNGNYSFDLRFVTDGVTNTANSGFFTVSYPTNAPRESDWGLLTQPIAFDPDTRDRITRDPLNSLNNRAWVTLNFKARLADGTAADAKNQVAFKELAGRFESVATDTNTSPWTYIPVSPLFRDAVQSFDSIQVRFNDRVVDAFPPVLLSANDTNLAPAGDGLLSRAGQFRLKILDNGPKALRLQVILRAQLKPWMTGLFPVLNDLNQLFDPSQVREFVTELEFREKPGTNGILESKLWPLDHVERLWGYKNEGGAVIAHYGWAMLDNLQEIEIRDRNGQQTLARFNYWQIKTGGTSAIEQLFTLTAFTNRAPAEAVGLDFVFETRLPTLQSKAASLGVPVSFGYAGVNAWIAFPNSIVSDDLDPFPTRYYHANGARMDGLHGGQKYDNVKAYSGDSGLIQEVGFSSNRIAGHIPFEFALRPWSDGTKGQQKIQIHPWVPYSFKKEAVTNVWSFGRQLDAGNFGLSVARAGDVNGDGYADIIIGAEYWANLPEQVGAAFVYSGGSNGLSNAPSWKAVGGLSDERFGGSVSSAGDLNRDGCADVIIGASGYSNGQPSEGAAFVYLGGTNGLSNSPVWAAEGNRTNAGFGGAVSGAGDVNRDGYLDVIIGAPGFSNGQTSEGAAFVYLGGPNGLSNSPAWTAEGNQTNAWFGASISSAGDVNGDGYGDVIIGAPGYPNFMNGFPQGQGAAFVYLGGTNGLSNSPSWSVQDTIFSSRLGSSVSSAGDLNGDGYGDVIIAEPEYFGGKGRVLVYFGSSIGLSNSPAWTAMGSSTMMGFGWKASGAGDVNGDGYSDVIIGARAEIVNGQYYEGIAFVYLGSAGGLSIAPAWDHGLYLSPSWNGGALYVSFPRYGTGVGTAGDVNGDGYDDVIVSAPDAGGFAGDGLVFVHGFPKETIYHRGWVRGGPSGGTDLGPRLPTSGVENLLPKPLVNSVVNCSSNNQFQVGLFYDSAAKRQRVRVTYSCGQSGFITNAPFPLGTASGAQWLSDYFYDATEMVQVPVPVDANGQTNVGWQLPANLKFAAVTNDMFITATPDAYDLVITNGLVDYTFVATADLDYTPTINYFSGWTAWTNLASRLPGYPDFAGLPAVVTDPALRPRLNITNIVLHYDTNFPTITAQDLHLDFSEPDPAVNGWDTAHILSAFNHTDILPDGFFRDWSLADDPNVRTAAQVETEDVRVTLELSRTTFARLGGLPATNDVPVELLSDTALQLARNLMVLTNSIPFPLNSWDFQNFLTADLSLKITRPPSTYSISGETEALNIENLDLTHSSVTFSVRSSRYRCQVTPLISGVTSNILGFRLGVELDPPVEFSMRKPLRTTDSLALPLQVIDREKFWQVDSGEYVANLFREVAIGTNALVAVNRSGYIIDSLVAYTSTNGTRPLATDPDYQAGANALFWKTPEGRIVKNPRVILGDITVTLKDPSGRVESPAFQENRYVPALTGEYFNDLYLDKKDLANLSWTAKIRPQAKEHAYVKIYGSVGGHWTLSYRKKESGQLSGLLPQDSGSLTWSDIISGTGRGQNQFLTYWDITELNGPHILRLISTNSPDNAYAQAEVKYLDVLLGQHLPGKSNPVFSPGGQAETMSLFSMHGRTQLTAAQEERGVDDLFFTVNPIKIEERPFSLGTNGTIPLGERVQILPHTESNPFSVNFYIDQQEYAIYDSFRLYHQLEEGTLAEITSLPPSIRPKYTLIQGYVEHTSIVGFLPNPSLRYCTLNVPGLSQDGIIRVAGSVDLYGTDNNAVKNEDLTVAIVVSTNANFYAGQVKARLTTGVKAEFPIATEATQALLATDWIPGSSNRTYHVYAVIVATNDNWLSMNRQLTPADEGQHMFNVTHTKVTMTTNVNGSLTIAGGLPIFSPNGDGVADRIQFLLDFQRAGLAQLEFLNEVGQSVHLQSVPLNTNGQASFFWDGNITGQGALTVAPDGVYTVMARYADGQDQVNTAAVVVEVRASSKYFGRLNPAGITNNTGAWRTLWTHVGGTVYNEDVVRIQYSDTTNFGVIRGERLVDRPELSALFDDLPTNLAPFAPDANGNLRIQYRLRVLDAVGNVGFSPVVGVDVPQRSRLTIASVIPLPGATSVSTEPSISILLSNASPFTVPELQTMLHLAPSVPGLLTLSPDRRTIGFVPGAPYAPGTSVAASLQLYPAATMTSSNTFSWSFSIISSNQISRSLQFRLLSVPGTLSGIGSEGTAFLLVTNSGNMPARLSVLPGAVSPSVLVAASPTNAALALPHSEISIPVSVTVTGQHSGSVSVPLTASEWSMGAITSLWMSVSVSSVTSPPSLLVTHTPAPTNAFMIKFTGQSQGSGPLTTLARLNGGSWWIVSHDSAWNFDATFAFQGDVLEILAIDSNNRSSTIYTHMFAAPRFVLAIGRDRSLMWDAEAGRIYTIEWSTNLLQWTPLPGTIQRAGSIVTVEAGSGPSQIADAPSGPLSVRFASNHPAANSTKAFFRVRSSTSLDDPPSEFVVLINKDRGLSWEAQAGQTYTVEWSTNLVNWATVTGAAQQNGATVAVSPGIGSLQLSNFPAGRIAINFATNHPAVTGVKMFFRIRGNN